MFHPLLENLSKIKDQDLENKILDLGRKFHIASRMGQVEVCQQIITILDSLKEEQRQRQLAATKKISKDNNSGLDDLINVD